MAQVTSIPRWRAWILGARPRTLPAAVAPVFVGSALAYADDGFSFWPALAALLAALLIQIGTNLANDYFDHIRGFDTVERKGPLRVAQSGLIPMGQLKLGTILVFAVTAAIGVYLIVVGGWPILAIGLTSILAAVAYSGGPYPLSSHGLGDIFAFVFFGLVAVFGTYYVQTLHYSALALYVAIPIGALTTAILIVNNYRDLETDTKVGKRTLAVMIGLAGSRIEYIATLVLAYGTPLVLWLAGQLSAWVLLTWLSLPLAVKLVRTLYRSTSGPVMNEALAGTARLDLVFSLLFTVGLVLS